MKEDILEQMVDECWLPTHPSSLPPKDGATR
jgi:hypothetical protein